MSEFTFNLTEQNFKQTVQKEGIVIIDFWAEWCGPCRSFAPVYDSVAQTNPDIIFAKVNTDEQQSLAGAFDIRGIPTLMIFRDGVRLFSQAGALPKPALEDLVKQARGVDMQKVHDEINKKNPAKA